MAESNNKPLYKLFANYTFSQLEELLLNATDQDEKDFYAILCQFFLAKKQKYVMEDKPF